MPLSEIEPRLVERLASGYGVSWEEPVRGRIAPTNPTLERTLEPQRDASGRFRMTAW